MATTSEETQMADDIESLKLKITELESMLKELSADPTPVDLSAEEVAAYHKVVGAIRRPPTICGRSCGRGCGRNCGFGQPCVLAASADEEFDFEDAAVMRPRPCGRSCGRGCGRNCGWGQPCVALAADEADFEASAVACRGCGRGCSYCYMSRPQPCSCVAGAAVAGSSPRGGVGRFARLGG